MTARLSPQAALYRHDRSLPALPPCIHCAGSERFVAKAPGLRATTAVAEAAAVQAAAQAAARARNAVSGRLHDRGFHRYSWYVLQRAQAAVRALPKGTVPFFAAAAAVPGGPAAGR
jgi:hypothetical protein